MIAGIREAYVVASFGHHTQQSPGARQTQPFIANRAVRNATTGWRGAVGSVPLDRCVPDNHVGGAAVRMPAPFGGRCAAGSTSSQHNIPREVHLWR